MFQCGLRNESCYGESDRQLAEKSGAYIGIWPLTNKRAQSRKDSAVCHHFLNCNCSSTFEELSVLYHKSLLIMKDRPSMNRSICSSPPFLSHFLLHSVDFSVFLLFYINASPIIFLELQYFVKIFYPFTKLDSRHNWIKVRISYFMLNFTSRYVWYPKHKHTNYTYLCVNRAIQRSLYILCLCD